MGALEFRVVLTINFRLLSVLVILRRERRRLITLSVTDHSRRSSAFEAKCIFEQGRPMVSA